MNLPNKLTLFRVILIPFFLFFVLTDIVGPASDFIALGIFAIASLTDALDGKIARKYNLVTNFGKFMDPIADKLLVSSALIAFVQTEMIPAWAVIILIAREFVISGFRLVAADTGIVLAASFWGKAKTAVQMVMCVIFLLYGPIARWISFGNPLASIENGMNAPEWMIILKWVLIGASVLLSIISLIDYLVKNRKVIADM